VLRANNNLDVLDHGGRRYLAWRTAPIHFASPRTYLHVVSSGDRGATWQPETTVDLGRDVREPRFFACKAACSSTSSLSGPRGTASNRTAYTSSSERPRMDGA